MMGGKLIGAGSREDWAQCSPECSREEEVSGGLAVGQSIARNNRVSMPDVNSPQRRRTCDSRVGQSLTAAVSGRVGGLPVGEGVIHPAQSSYSHE